MTYKAVAKMLLTALCLLGSVAWATTLYVNGATGNDTNNNCTSTPCKTIGHAISVAVSGDSIKVAAATYNENLTINTSLRIIGSGAKTTIINGRDVSNVVTLPNASTDVILSNLAIQNGLGIGVYHGGGGISNSGNLKIIASAISGNKATTGGCTRYCLARGGGIANYGTLTISNSTVSGNRAISGCTSACIAWGGGIFNGGTLIINNTTLSGNGAQDGGAIFNEGPLTNINNSTLSENTAGIGPNISNYNYTGYKVALQNSIAGGCAGTITSTGYNLSSDGTCNFDNIGDINNTDPLLGTLGYYGGQTQTIPLLSGSPAIDAGNPSGCTDGQGNLLKTDQRGAVRPDSEDAAGCDMGAYERQSD